jgi:tetratricopeptide (TPR) repeat protein
MTLFSRDLKFHFPSQATCIMGLDFVHVLSSERHYCEYQCGICKRLTSLESFVSTLCFHVICKSCCQDELRPESCPACLEVVKTWNDLGHNQPLAHRVLCRVKVACPSRKKYGCSWTGDYSALQTHIENHRRSSWNHNRNTSRGNGKNRPEQKSDQHAGRLFVETYDSGRVSVNVDSNKVEDSNEVNLNQSTLTTANTIQNKPEIGSSSFDKMEKLLSMKEKCVKSYGHGYQHPTQNHEQHPSDSGFLEDESLSNVPSILTKEIVSQANMQGRRWSDGSFPSHDNRFEKPELSRRLSEGINTLTAINHFHAFQKMASLNTSVFEHDSSRRLFLTRSDKKVIKPSLCLESKDTSEISGCRYLRVKSSFGHLIRRAHHSETKLQSSDNLPTDLAHSLRKNKETENTNKATGIYAQLANNRSETSTTAFQLTSASEFKNFSSQRSLNSSLSTRNCQRTGTGLSLMAQLPQLNVLRRKFVIGSSVTPKSRSSNDTNAAKKLQIKAGNSFQAGNYHATVDHTSQALLCLPFNDNAESQLTSIYLKRAVSYFRLCQYAKCIQDCEDLLTIDFTKVKAYLWKARAHSELGQFKTACSTLAIGIGRIPQAVELERELNETKKIARSVEQINHFIEEKKYNLVLDCTQSTDATNLNKHILLARAKASLKLEQFSRAIDATNSVFLQDHLNVEALEIRATAKFMEGHLEDALMDCQTALGICPSLERLKVKYKRFREVEHFFLAAEFEMRDESFVRAAVSYSKAIQNAEPLNKKTELYRLLHTSRAKAHFLGSNYIQALANINLALDSLPSHVESQNLRDNILVAMNLQEEMKNESNDERAENN